MLEKIDIHLINEIAIEAGRRILTIYEGKYTVIKKADDSPLTEADRASHDYITVELERHFPGIPILSEEGAQIPYEQRKTWPVFWLVDPLDGTKEFVKRNGEFTVNIALIEKQTPVLGVVYAPIVDTLYFAKKGQGAYKTAKGVTNRLSAQEKYSTIPIDKPLRVVVSASHPSRELDEFLSRLTIIETVKKGSSLKMCLVAEGAADIYPRLGPTSEWDTAAANAIVIESGKNMQQYPSLEPMMYNKESLRNPWFVVY